MGSAQTVSDVCEMIQQGALVKYNDLLLNSQWRHISEPDTAPVQTILRLESNEEKIKRDIEEEEERKKLVPRWNPHEYDDGRPQHWKN